jgi:hypothetical protein
MEEGSSPAVKRLREDEEPTAEPSAVAAPVVDELFVLLQDGKVVSTPRDALLTASNTLRLLSEDVDLTQNALDNALPLPQIDSKIWEVVASLLSAPSMVEAALAKTPLLDVMDLVKALSFLDMPALSAQAISYVARNGERASREVPPNVVASLPDDCRTALVMNVLFERNGPLSGEKDDFGISKLFFGRGMVCIGAGLLSEGVLAILLLDVGKRMTLCRYDASTLNELSRVDLGESPWNWAVVKFACGGGRMCCYGLGGLWVADHASPDVKTKLVLPLSAANAVPVPPIRAEPKIRGEPKISALIVSPDGEWVACCCDDDTVSLFSAATGALTMHLVNPRPVDLVFFWRGGTGSPVFSADSTLLFVRQGGRAKIISVARGEVLHDLGTCQRVFTPPDDARLVVVVAQDGSMRFVDPKTAETTRIVDGQAGLNGDQLTRCVFAFFAFLRRLF